MKLIPDARRVALTTYSFWAQVLGLLALLLPELRYVVTGRDTDPVLLWWAGVLLLLFGLIGRLVQQTGSVLRNLLRIAAVALLILLAAFTAARAMADVPPSGAGHPASEAETLAIAVPFIAGWEGKRNAAYLDIVGVPTICFGSTRGVRLGQVMTDAECLAMLRAEVAEYRAGVHRYFTDDTITRRLPPPRDAAWTSFGFNVGISAAGRSTATRRLNAGELRGACEALSWWNRAGQRVVRGLVNRRAEEKALCMEGV